MELLPPEFGPYIRVIGANSHDCSVPNGLKFSIESSVSICVASLYTREPLLPYWCAASGSLIARN